MGWKKGKFLKDRAVPAYKRGHGKVTKKLNDQRAAKKGSKTFGKEFSKINLGLSKPKFSKNAVRRKEKTEVR